ncbi:MAG TPA: energy transducer TonB [Candidatus Wunengus sp. YC60]|uniref:energy transducer TonB n=1 Tax=Candidatus Wunengus sp. YC60 TaxID=3367697 RepID=UPI00402A5650
MKINLFFGISCALALHAVIILFGGLLFNSHEKDHGTLQQVELLSNEDVSSEKEKAEDLKTMTEKTEEMETESEQVPDASEIVRNLELSAADSAPELEAASLSAIEAALSGQAGSGGDFAEALSFSSGGRIGGMGKTGAMDERLGNAFSLGEIDQKPRAIFQAAPVFPNELRGKKLEGVVTVLFVVDQTGKVAQPRVVKSSHPAFEKPALDAVKQWKFEPAIKGGQRVPCKMRVPIRFQPS